MNHKTSLIAAAGALMTLVAQGAQAQAATYAIDPTHTFVTFEVPHFGTSTNRGRFDKKEGTVQFDRAGKTGKVEITIDTGSINTGTAPFDKHLKSAEILNVEAQPTAKFVGDKFSFNGDKVGEVTGMLTLNGKTNPVTLKANNFNCYQSPMLKREVCGGDFETMLVRSQFGVTYGLNYGFPDAIKLVIQVEAVKQ
ncbi:MAG TPA: YceI family protein [Ideonella sp.]|uniref:YceI family protein n=1 Tax=Ideonella sp. TaxID=1929293 RepID=UPI002E2F7170|nr:YceI family protein [Ideonella sp.]HEX5682530.1 YceI family protein [Ideonella sp.]